MSTGRVDPNKVCMRSTARADASNSSLPSPVIRIDCLAVEGFFGNLGRTRLMKICSTDQMENILVGTSNRRQGATKYVSLHGDDNLLMISYTLRCVLIEKFLLSARNTAIYLHMAFELVGLYVMRSMRRILRAEYSTCEKKLSCVCRCVGVLFSLMN